MMVHLYLENGEHAMFGAARYVENGRAVSIETPQEENTAILYVYPQFVGFFTRPQIFKLIPISKVKEIHMTRKAGESWGT